ncbi:hypothetical protein QJQ45_006029 [Haematococcus lacustris]|nr:hypothetical protein QJQ45_006029 [Haematococcus lacustris]
MVVTEAMKAEVAVQRGLLELGEEEQVKVEDPIAACCVMRDGRLQARYAQQWQHEEAHRPDQEALQQEVHNAEVEGFMSLARLGLMRPSTSAGTSPSGRWQSGMHRAVGSSAARRMREASRLNALQRTPYPMVLARIKLLLDRLQSYKAASPSTPGSRSLNSASRSMRASTMESFHETARSSMTRDNWIGGEEEDEPGLGSRMSMEQLMEELSTTLGYVSEFLRQVPEPTRMAAIMWVKMETFKKDQMVYKVGDFANQFYIILTGTAEVWTQSGNNTRQRTVLASLKRGQSFGEHAILNSEPRSECVVPTSSCTFLTVEQDAFLTIFGAFFQEKLAQAQAFFKTNVLMFQRVPEEEGWAVLRHMLLSTYPAGREWEPINEHQIYFVKEGGWRGRVGGDWAGRGR